MDIYGRVKACLALSGADVISLGSSCAGRSILAAHRGSYCGKQVIVTAGIHARECYTATVVLAQLFSPLPVGTGAYYIPLVNPDGACFFESGDGRGYPILEGGDRTAWKANAEGVDLNCNFDADWGRGKHNTVTPGASGFVGNYPLCAPETRALAEFTRRVRPAATVSYHSMGGELYWEFFQTGARRRRDMAVATAVAGHIGVERVDGHLFSAGGYKDWCIRELKIPALTVELVKTGAHPLGEEAYVEDMKKNTDLPGFLLGLI